MSSQIATAEKRYRMSLLLDRYGRLLTEKQRTFIQRHYEEDYSFGEIAGEFHVTRQAIFDAVKHGETSLERYEQVLGLVDEHTRRAKGITNGAQETERDDVVARTRAGSRQLRALADRISSNSEPEDPAGIITDLQSLAEEMDRIAWELQSHRIVSDTESDGDDQGQMKPNAPTLIQCGEGPEVD